MADPRDSPATSSAVCWQCGRAADPNASYTATLVASSKRALNPLGFPVKRGKQRDAVRVPVPRCRDCRGRDRASLVIVLAGAVAGAIVVPPLWSQFGPHGPQPSWLRADSETGNNPVTGAGIVVGVVIALLGVAWQKRRLGLRSLNAYPSIVAVRSEGWDWPND